MEEEIDIIRQASIELNAVLSACSSNVPLSPASASTSSLSLASDAGLMQLAVELEALGRKVDALRVQVAGEIGDRSRIELGHDGLAYAHGCKKPDHLLEQTLRISSPEAARRLRVASATRVRLALDGAPLPATFPAVSAALSTGAIPVESADVIIRCLSQAQRAADPVWVADAETALVDTATRDCVALVALNARVWREALDPDGAAPRDEQLREKRSLTLGRNVNGMTLLTGWLDPINEALVRSLFTEGTGPGRKPRFLPGTGAEAGAEWEAEAGTGVGVGADVRSLSLSKGPADPTAPVDPRTRAQRQFDILIGTLTAGIRSTDTPGTMRALTAVNVVVTVENFDSGRGAAWIDDSDEPISATHAKELACDAGIRHAVLSPAGEVLHLGKPQRLFSTAQRNALAIRDGGCVWPNCTAPPKWCHAHHVLFWEHGGRTELRNGLLLCPAHHHMLHNSDYRFTMRDGVPYLTAPTCIDPTQTARRVGRNRARMADGWRDT